MKGVKLTVIKLGIDPAIKSVSNNKKRNVRRVGNNDIQTLNKLLKPELKH